MKKWQLTLLRVTTIIIAFLIIFGIYWHFRFKKLGTLTTDNNNTPTLCIPGDNGNWTSFGPLLKRWQKYDLATYSEVIKISSTGKLTFEKKNHATKNPMIQVLFEDNTHITHEAKQLGALLAYLKKNRKVMQVNLMGHSSGGSIIMEYLINQGSEKKMPTTKKFVSLANDYSPEMKFNRLPHNLELYVLYAEMWHLGTDGMVKTKLAKGTAGFVTPYVKSTETKFYRGGLSAFHMLLHENPDVDLIAANWLFNSQ